MPVNGGIKIVYCLLEKRVTPANMLLYRTQSGNPDAAAPAGDPTRSARALYLNSLRSPGCGNTADSSSTAASAEYNHSDLELLLLYEEQTTFLGCVYEMQNSRCPVCGQGV